ncbi:MAG: PIN domain-containing protein [Candidatus Omnitrophota bacterium]
MRKLRLYLETSVWSFFFADDAPEKRDVTKRFFDSASKEVYEIFFSEVVIRELNNAPEPRKTSFTELLKKFTPIKLEITDEIEELASLYIERRAIPAAKRNDALHVSVATIYELDAVITWNYQHLANLRRAEVFNGINLERGYTKHLEIVTPMEVSKNES